jgi:hypothetical protein
MSDIYCSQCGEEFWVGVDPWVEPPMSLWVGAPICEDCGRVLKKVEKALSAKEGLYAPLGMPYRAALAIANEAAKRSKKWLQEHKGVIPGVHDTGPVAIAKRVWGVDVFDYMDVDE